MANIITRRRGADWIAFRVGDEHHGARGYGATEEAAVRNLVTSFPDDGPAVDGGRAETLVPADLFAAEARARILGAAVKYLRGRLDAATRLVDQE